MVMPYEQVCLSFPLMQYALVFVVKKRFIPHLMGFLFTTIPSSPVPCLSTL